MTLEIRKHLQTIRTLSYRSPHVNLPGTTFTIGDFANRYVIEAYKKELNRKRAYVKNKSVHQ